jgi:Tryptophan-associated transmembrane protein (Trp_oprn_chp)
MRHCGPMTTSRRRTIGFVLGAAGALAAGVGSLLTWTVVGLRADTQGVLDERFRGVDLASGIVVLVAAGLILIGLLAIRVVPDAVRLSIALGMILIGLAIVTAPVLALATAEDRAAEEMAVTAAAEGGLTPAEAAELIRTNPAFAIRWQAGSGIWLAIVGGIAVITSGAMIAGERRRPG